ncbi:hypothetical protein FACS189438_0510 [Bacteroidia bacterium]|nr:hypothetical protein FACS189438_0510 [Bacteroidia bacterium]
MLQIVYLLVFVLALFNVKSIGQKSKINIFFIIYVISVVLSSMILFTMNASYANRISLYFMIAILFVIPFVIQNCQNTIKISKILFAGFMACIFLLFLYIISSVNTLGMDNYIPYKTIFSE